MKTILTVTLFTLVALLAIAVLGTAPANEAFAADSSPPDGKAVFEAQKCATCHAVPAAGIEAKTKSEKMKGPDLPGPMVGQDKAWIAAYLRQQESAEGGKHKKEFKGSDEELQALIDWLLKQT